MAPLTILQLSEALVAAGTDDKLSGVRGGAAKVVKRGPAEGKRALLFL